MIPKELVLLSTFLRAARGRSPEEIITEFLDAVLDRENPNSPIEEASILVDHPEEKVLKLFNDDPTKKWETTIPYHSGVAGQAYREGATVESGKFDLFWKGPIKHVVCIPIKSFGDAAHPFGVACFFDNDEKKRFSKNDIWTLEFYVDVLALALHVPRSKAVGGLAQRPVDERKLKRHKWDLQAGEGPQGPPADIAPIPNTETKVPKAAQRRAPRASGREMSTPLIFISYSHKDPKWLEFVQGHLEVAVVNGHFETWNDRRIEGGADWVKEIDAALWKCSVFILLVSRYSLVSTFILKREVRAALEEHWKRGLRIYPILVEPCFIKGAPWLTKMNIRPREAKALSLYPRAKREEVMASLVAEIHDIVVSAPTNS